MKVIKNTLSNVPKMPCDIDKLDDLPFVPKYPLPCKSFAMMLVGSPGSGKTNLLMALFTSKKNVYYRKLFDHVEIISASLATLPKTFKKQLPEEQLHNSYSDELLIDLIDKMKSSEKNENCCVVIDDCVRDLSKSKVLSKIFFNRRHQLYDETKKGIGGLSVITTSQKYNSMPLVHRSAMSNVILFRSSNNSEIKAIKEELLADLSPSEQEKLLKFCWSEPHSFLFIDLKKNKDEKYFKMFDKIVWDNDVDLNDDIKV